MWRCGSPGCNCEGHRLGWLDGDNVAAKELLRNVKPFVAAIIRRRLPNAPPDQWHDIEQDTFLLIHRGLARWKRVGRLCLWAGVIAARAAIGQLRRDRRTARVAASADPDLLADRRSQPLPPHVWRCIDRMLERLPDNLRRAFDLHVIQGLTIEQTAEEMGVSERSIFNWLERIKQLLLACLD